MTKNPIIILHGWNLNRERFKSLINVLNQKNYKVYCPDLPGFGNAKMPDKAFDLSDYVDFVISYLNKNRISKADFICHSFGGRVGIKLAAFYPKRVGLLILTGVPGVLPVPKLKVIFFWGLAKIAKLFFSLPFLNLFKNSSQKFIYRVARASDFYNTDPKLKKTFQLVVKEQLVTYLKKIQSSVLLIWGKNDKIVPISVAEKMKLLIPKSDLLIVENTAHALPFSDPEIFYQKIETFLKS